MFVKVNQKWPREDQFGSQIASCEDVWQVEAPRILPFFDTWPIFYIWEHKSKKKLGYLLTLDVFTQFLYKVWKFPIIVFVSHNNIPTSLSNFCFCVIMYKERLWLQLKKVHIIIKIEHPLTIDHLKAWSLPCDWPWRELLEHCGVKKTCEIGHHG